MGHKVQGTKPQGGYGSGCCSVSAEDRTIESSCLHTKYRFHAVNSDGWLISTHQVPRHVAYGAWCGCGRRAHKRPLAAAVIIKGSMAASGPAALSTIYANAGGVGDGGGHRWSLLMDR